MRNYTVTTCVRLKHCSGVVCNHTGVKNNLQDVQPTSRKRFLTTYAIKRMPRASSPGSLLLAPSVFFIPRVSAPKGAPSVRKHFASKVYSCTLPGRALRYQGTFHAGWAGLLPHESPLTNLPYQGRWQVDSGKKDALRIPSVDFFFSTKLDSLWARLPHEIHWSQPEFNESSLKFVTSLLPCLAMSQCFLATPNNAELTSERRPK